MGRAKYVWSSPGSLDRGTMKNGSGAGVRVKVSQGLHPGVGPSPEEGQPMGN